MIQRLFPAFLFIATAGSGWAAIAPNPALTKEQTDFFEAKIRPIFAENCYKCHSVEKGKAKGGLTLDSRDGWAKGGESGPAIEPGAPEKSLLLKAVGYLDPDLQMPPKGEKLRPEEIALLADWVKMGAADPRKEPKNADAKLTGLNDQARHHWSYQPVRKPAVPQTNNQVWIKTPVDAFVLQKLDEKGMSPSPDASKETLLRRATYDLIGLPPTPQEVEAFVNDTTLQAFAKVVDRLLASPHYGERWGRFWLDTARYADTKGGERNNLRGGDYRFPYAWTYRDWVVNAINADLPYDQFVVQQLAADKLPNNPPQNLAALGFLTVGERFRNVNDVINDRIDVVSKGFLAMTVTCARCHDHMFDPIPTKDYYALHGIFASTIEPAEKPVISAAGPGNLIAYQQKFAALEDENRRQYYRFVSNVQTELFEKIDSYLLASRFGGRRNGSAEEIQARNRIMNSAKLDREIGQLFVRQTRREDPIFAPFKWFAELEAGKFEEGAPGVLADIAKGKLGRWKLNPLVVAAFKDAQPKSIEEVTAIYKALFASLQPQLVAFHKASAEALVEPIAGLPTELLQIFQVPFEVLPASQANTQGLRDFASRLPNQLGNRSGFIFARINELELTDPAAPARAMLVADAMRPRDSAVFIRGQAETRGEVVPRRFLEILSPQQQPVAFKDGSGRLELAQSIASKTNPLTARVLVNRVWMHHFGEGFVRTPEDLGTQSEAPSHPELLDYLASYVMDAGWSLKRLHKLIMLSHVYHEGIYTVPSFEQIDPENRLLWRANIRRLDFEATRDSLLVFSGKLDQTVGGKPINLTDEPYSYRRSVYGYIDRGNLPELMANFDFSDPDMPNSKRTTTIVPQQALFLMNSPMSVDVARKIVARPEVANAGDDLGRIIAIYRIIFQRPPKPEEIQIAYQFVGQEARTGPAPTNIAAAAVEPPDRMNRRQRMKLANRPMNPRRAAVEPIKNLGEIVERKPLTPWETYAQALLLSNEAAYVN
jgi:mono/diheme cytochrome c family protein